MSPARSSSITRVPLRVWLLFFAALALLLLYFALIARFAPGGKFREGFEALDDVQAARELLAQKFTGPQYFQIGEEKDQMPYPCISMINARTQLERIVKERQLVPAAVAQINQLINELTVPASSRVVGIDHVNALQLNLALDKLR